MYYMYQWTFQSSPAGLLVIFSSKQSLKKLWYGLLRTFHVGQKFKQCSLVNRTVNHFNMIFDIGANIKILCEISNSENSKVKYWHQNTNLARESSIKLSFFVNMNRFILVREWSRSYQTCTKWADFHRTLGHVKSSVMATSQVYFRLLANQALLAENVENIFDDGLDLLGKLQLDI